MSHDYHEALPSYDPEQILHDGCHECEMRSQRRDYGLSSLDRDSFARAWERAARWNKNGLPNIAYAEMPLLTMLWAVQLQLERRGFRIGKVPS